MKLRIRKELQLKWKFHRRWSFCLDTNDYFGWSYWWRLKENIQRKNIIKTFRCPQCLMQISVSNISSKSVGWFLFSTLFYSAAIGNGLLMLHTLLWWSLETKLFLESRDAANKSEKQKLANYMSPNIQQWTK